MSKDQQALDTMQSIGDLLYRRWKSELSVEEQIELDNWMNEQSLGTREFIEEFMDEDQIWVSISQMYQFDEEAALEAVKRDAGIEDRSWNPPIRKFRNNRPWYHYLLAASLLTVVIGSGVIFIFKVYKERVAGSSVQKNIKTDILPGGNKATLVLADGSHIDLDKASVGTLAKQGSSQVIKLDDGQLAYKAEKSSTGSLAYNTIYTPTGGQYRVILPDHSIAYLNAASSLTYPSNFATGAREVTLTGEGYFEIAKNKQQPFFVRVGDMKIQVLGTRFNIMAYKNERSVQATLLDGSISIIKNDQTSILKPGEQASVGSTDITINKVDTSEAVAWKNGYFLFNDAPVDIALRSLARWYSVDIKFDAPVSGKTVSARLSRGKNAEEILKIMQMGGIKFIVMDKTIHVTE